MTPTETLNAHLREIVQWHFSEDTGTPFWRDWARERDFDAVAEINSVHDLSKFEHFKDDWLRFEAPERWVPAAYKGRPYNVFETGGTTGMPKQRLNWEDYQYDYSQFATTLSDTDFPPGGHWLMIGPTGPRRLRLSIEHLANVRNSSVYFVDLDPRWVKKVIAKGDFDHAKAYMEHVIDQAVLILKHRDVSALFTTPRLLETLGEKLSIPECGVKGVFVGGTEMNPQMVRFLIEETLENKVSLLPVYGNTLMGLAHSIPPTPENDYSITYYPPQPRAILRVVDPKDSSRVVNYGEWGRVELTTLTRELFMPRFLERDEAIRREPTERYPWDGVAEVRPFEGQKKNIIEGVY